MLETAIRAAKEAEKIILYYYKKELEEERKDDRSLVTIADREAEEKIREIILSDFPGHQILGEEKGEIGEVGDYLWIVDPIDGTTNYKSHIPLFATSIALYKKGKPVLSVLNLPVLKKMITAEVGKGAYSGGKRLSVSSKDNLEFGLLAIGYGSDDIEVRKKAAEIFSKFINRTRTARVLGSQVVQGSILALGEIDAFISSKASVWDFAGIAIAIREAGGVVTDFHGKPWNLKSTELIASNPKIHNKLVEIISA